MRRLGSALSGSAGTDGARALGGSMKAVYWRVKREGQPRLRLMLTMGCLVRLSVREAHRLLKAASDIIGDLAHRIFGP